MYRIIEAGSNLSFGQKKNLQEAINDADFLAMGGGQYNVIGDNDNIFYTAKPKKE